MTHAWTALQAGSESYMQSQKGLWGTDGLLHKACQQLGLNRRAWQVWAVAEIWIHRDVRTDTSCLASDWRALGCGGIRTGS